MQKVRIFMLVLFIVLLWFIAVSDGCHVFKYGEPLFKSFLYYIGR